MHFDSVIISRFSLLHGGKHAHVWFSNKEKYLENHFLSYNPLLERLTSIKVKKVSFRILDQISDLFSKYYLLFSFPGIRSVEAQLEEELQKKHIQKYENVWVSYLKKLRHPTSIHVSTTPEYVSCQQ